MCDFSGKLIAWMDRELPADEALCVEHHLQMCAECQGELADYQRMSNGFDSYCDAALASSQRTLPRWTTAAVAGTIAAIIALALYLALPRTSDGPQALAPDYVATLPSLTQTSAAARRQSLNKIQNKVSKAHPRPGVTSVQIRNADSSLAHDQNSYSQAPEPAIQIAFPADEMLPPGAIPEGIHFVGDLTLAADGSAERLRLRPRLATFERNGAER